MQINGKTVKITNEHVEMFEEVKDETKLIICLINTLRYKNTKSQCYEETIYRYCVFKKRLISVFNLTIIKNH